eukprot:GHVQ01043662.1.p1 GENE.GHVQ01043662.1~~GHVQ01043662.1.p1  ORF type:complete len:102 (-),score=21.76 GHVQ01043662.1:88-393(-)
MNVWEKRKRNAMRDMWKKMVQRSLTQASPSGGRGAVKEGEWPAPPLADFNLLLFLSNWTDCDEELRRLCEYAIRDHSVAGVRGMNPFLGQLINAALLTCCA